MPIPPIVPYPMPGPDDLPENTVDWAVDPTRAVLLIHDMQRYFTRFFVPGCEPVTHLVDSISRLRQAAAARQIPVVYTAQPGEMTVSERGLLRDFWGDGMSAEAADRAIVDQLAPGPVDAVLTKWRYSAFHCTGLAERMRGMGRDQLVITGVYAHVGCLVTAVDALSYDIRAFLVADAVADFSADFHHCALAYAAGRCAAIATTADVLDAFGTDPAATVDARLAHAEGSMR